MAGKLNFVHTGQTTTNDSAVVYCDRLNDDFGVFHIVRISSGGTFSVTLQGRSTPAAAWANIVTLTEANLRNEDASSATFGGAGQVVQLMPEMRVRITAISSATLNTYILE